LAENEDELKELIRLLKKLLSRRYSYGYRVGQYLHRPRPYKPRLGSRANFYKPTRYEERAYSRPQQDYKPKPTSTTSYAGRPWTEPQIYRPSERLVYDPEVKQLLQRIEKHLEPDVEEMLEKLEENPELYDEISERLLAKINEERVEKAAEINSEENERAEEINSEQAESEVSDEAKREENENAELVEESDEGGAEELAENEDLLKDEFLGDEAVPEGVEANELSGESAELPLEEALEPSEELSTSEAVEDIEPSSSEAEFDLEPVTEALEALDLSPLEAELYPELEALEAEERLEAEDIEG